MLMEANSLWKCRDDVGAVVDEVEANVEAGLEEVIRWLKAVGDAEMEKKTEPEGWATSKKGSQVTQTEQDVQGSSQDDDQDDDFDADSDDDTDLVIKLDMDFDKVPTAEEAAIYIWNQMVDVNAQYKAMEDAIKAQFASQPGNVWAAEHGKLTFEIHSEAYTGLIAVESYPYIGSSVLRGSLEAPFTHEVLMNEVLELGSEYYQRDDVTRPQKIAWQYFNTITEVAGDPGKWCAG